MEAEMVGAKLSYGWQIGDNDPRLCPVLIVGQLKNLARIKFDDVKCKFAGRVCEEVYGEALVDQVQHYNSALEHPLSCGKATVKCYSAEPDPPELHRTHAALTDFQLALKRLGGSHSEPISLYLNYATVAAIPDAASRHNAPSRPHSLTKLVKAESFDVNGETILVVCERKDIFASGCAVARAFPQYSRKTGRAETSPHVTVEFLVVEDDGSIGTVTRDEASALQDAADGVRLAAKIVDAPCNEMNVDGFLAEVVRVGQQCGARMTVLRGDELKEKGMGGLYGVGRAASCPPALAVLSHTPPGATQCVAWVGKGIVYDSGGLSIKSKTTMPGMKRDCGGAAGVLGAFYATVKQGFSQNLHAIFCLAENSVGPDATRPDDIHTLYSGRTVEINNTDAEGRLVLADGVVYAQRDLKADLILDMATLTGAQAICTGKVHAAVLTNCGDWERNLVAAGQTSGDLTFPILYCPELHFNEFTSAVADMKNSVGDRENCQSSCAGLFIQAHLGFDFPGVWIHIDMASPVHVGERATGYGVALLTSLFGGFSNHKFLQFVGQNIDLKISKQKRS